MPSFATPFVRSSAAVLALAAALAAMPVPVNPVSAEPAIPVETQAASPAVMPMPMATAMPMPVVSFAPVVKSQLGAVVNITTQTNQTSKRASSPPAPNFPPGSPFNEFFRDFHRGDPQEQVPSAVLGTGFVVDAAGWIVTNHHVVAEATEIAVVFQDGKKLSARLAGTDPATDLAVLKVDSDHPLAVAQWGDSDAAAVGDWVLAIGNPFGLGGTVTAGILSARARDIQQGPYDEYLQTDTPINRGNSGGPLYSLDGRVIGINAAIYSPSGGSVGIAFAIPSNLARPIIEQLKDHGSVQRGWLGVQVQVLTPELAESMGVPQEKGALVAAVTPGGPAQRGGIRQGDVITGFGGVAIDQMRTLPRVVSLSEIGKHAEVTLIRRGKPHTVPVKVGSLPEAKPVALGSTGGGTGGGAAPSGASDPPVEPPLGLSMAPLTPRARVAYGIDRAIDGVVVTGVRQGGSAAAQGLDAGDVIVETGQHPVTQPDEVMARIREARDQGRRSVPLLINRQGDLRYVAVPVTAGGEGRG